MWHVPNIIMVKTVYIVWVETIDSVIVGVFRMVQKYAFMVGKENHVLNVSKYFMSLFQENKICFSVSNSSNTFHFYL